MVISMGGIGPDGHIAFNESGSCFVKIIKKIMGYTKEQATSKIDRILDFSKEGYTKKGRNVSVCGVMFLLNITGESDNENYHFVAVDKKVKFKLSVKDCNELKESILNYSAK